MNTKEFKELVITELKKIEVLPESEDDSILDISKCSYPLSRNTKSYFSKLPKLNGCLDTCTSLLDIGAGNCIAIGEMAQCYPKIHFVGTGIQSITVVPNGVEYIIATASELPFKASSFDIVITVHGLSWEFEQQKAIEEIYRVLKPKGKAFLFFTPFEYSVDHKLGESFWNNRYDKNECKKYGININELEKRMKIELERKPMKHPYKEHKESYYIEVEKA